MGFQIKEARERAGFTQKELAELIGVAANTFHGYESGKHDPKSDLLMKIADACNVSTDFLLGRTFPENEKSPNAQNVALRGTVDASRVEAMLIQLGFIAPGQDLTDADLDFLMSTGDIIRAWFAKGK